MGNVKNCVDCPDCLEDVREDFEWMYTLAWISNQVRQPAEFKHIIKRRKRN